MKCKRASAGFTVVEVVVAVAIIAILAGVLAPQYTGYLEKSRTKTCQANIDGITSKYSMEKGFSGGNDYGKALTLALSSAGLSGYEPIPRYEGDAVIAYKGEGLCPSGGVYRVVVDADRGIVDGFWCDLHGGSQIAMTDLTYENGFTAIYDILQTKVVNGKTILDGMGKQINSADPNGTFNKAINETLTDYGYITGENTLWKVTRNNEKTTYNIFILDTQGQPLEVKKYTTGQKLQIKNGEVNPREENVTINVKWNNNNKYFYINES